MANTRVFISVITGFILSFFEQYLLVILLVITAIIFDVITGLLKAKITQTLNSKVSFSGIWKKLSLLLALFFGIYLDAFIPVLFEMGIDIELGISLPFGITVGSFIIINESVSICENLYESGTPMPQIIVKALHLAKNEIKKDDQSSNSEEDK